MKLKKLAPWNWFKSEDDEENKHDEQSGLSRRKSSHEDSDHHPLARLHREMDRMFDDFFPVNLPRMSQKWWKLADNDFSMLKPSVDISESKNEYKVRVEVPGVEKDGIHVSVRDHSLIIHGEKKNEHVEEDEHFHRVERFFGTFQRTLNLPPDANTAEVDASFKNGVLTLKVKRRPEKKLEGGHTIEIK